MSSINNYIRRTKGEDREDINRLLGVMSDIFYPEPEEGSVQERIVLAAERRKRTVTVTSGAPDVEESETRNRYAVNPHMKQIPTSVSSYPLTHTTTGTLSTIKTTGLKMGAGMTTNGASYITIDDDARLDDITTDLTIAFWFYGKANAGGTELLVSRDLGWQVYTTSGDILTFRVYNGSWSGIVTYDYTANIDTWISVVCTYNTTNGLILYINGSSSDTDATETGSISTGTAAVKILGDGISDPASGTGMAWLEILDDEWTSGEASSYHNGLTDMSGKEDMIGIDFAGNEDPTPAATSPFCVSS